MRININLDRFDYLLGLKNPTQKEIEEIDSYIKKASKNEIRIPMEFISKHKNRIKELTKDIPKPKPITNKQDVSAGYIVVGCCGDEVEIYGNIK